MKADGPLRASDRADSMPAATNRGPRPKIAARKTGKVRAVLTASEPVRSS